MFKKGGRMLEGITVLNQTTIYKGIIPEWVLLVLLIGGIVCFAICWMCASNYWDLATKIFGGLSIICLLTMLVLFLWWPTEPTGRYRYECTIDESVSMTEVYERYEIIEQRGDIWVLEDKE